MKRWPTIPNPLWEKEVHRYIEYHVDEEINTEDIAKVLKLSRTYLSSLFRKESGIKLNDFINKVKITESKRLISTTDQSFAEISDQLGFSSQSYFQTVFKKIEGQTPNHFRKTNSVK